MAAPATFYKAISIGLALAAMPVGFGAALSEQAEFFESRIRPLFAAKCYSCHADSKLGGLRLDSSAGVLTGGKSGPAVIPGKASESLLIQRVKEKDPGRRMPMGS